MSMDALSSFFAMGGYGGYVWPSYGLAVVVMVAVLVSSIRSAKARERELDLLQQMRPSRARRRATQETKAS
ncbi:MAG: heme exporter protein CcmD [Rhodospirillaceae bacterium]|nr:heme exporter protein CcmD [Rhodospirillales bacterium]